MPVLLVKAEMLQKKIKAIANTAVTMSMDYDKLFQPPQNP